MKSQCRAFIFRVSWIYSLWGANFKNTILRLARERDELRIVSDQWGAPTKAEDIAEYTKLVMDKCLSGAVDRSDLGIFHCRFSEYTNWYQFALGIIEEARIQGVELRVKNVIPITSEMYPTAAIRPKNSRLSLIHSNLLKV